MHEPGSRGKTTLQRAARGILAALLFGPVAAGPIVAAPRPDRVLVITVDTLRWDHLSSNGYPLPTTPFVDELLAGGYVFDRAVTPIPRTPQALASLWSGLYPQRHGLRGLFGRLSPRVPLLAEAAREAGYATVAVVSNHILVPERGLLRGWDLYDYADDARNAESTTDEALDRLAGFERDQPLFLWVHYIDPHVPYYPPGNLARMFSPDYEGPYRYHFGQVKGGIGDAAYPVTLGKAGAVFENRLPEEVNEHVRRLYAADVRATDDAIARLVSGLRARFGPDWLIVFTADHGESLGEHGYFYDHGDYVYNASLRIPLGIVLPADHPLHGTGSVRDWVSLIDVAPTLAELLHLDWPPEGASTLDGRSLVGHMTGSPPPPRPVFAESGKSFFPRHVRGRTRFDESGRFRAVILGRQKLIWTPFRTGKAAYQLYDVVGDPHETRDLYDPHRYENVEPLWRYLSAWVDEQPGAPALPSDDDLQRLRSLGYVE